MSQQAQITALASRIAAEIKAVRSEMPVVVEMTQAAYDQITPDPAILYVIID